MEFTGYLSKFSLPEIFEFLEQGCKTGLLSIRTLKTEQQKQAPNHYIWLRQGRIVGAANTLDNQGLLSLISNKTWINKSLATEKFQASGEKISMGLCLKSQGLLSAEQLTLLFRTQVMGQISSLFELENGKFDFDFNAPIPAAEMTGLSMLTAEATIKALRSLRNWSAFTTKLPDSCSCLAKKTAIPTEIQLDFQESKVWECTNGETPLNEISTQFLIPLEKVRQIAFRFIVSNLSEEIFTVNPIPAPILENTQELVNTPEFVNISSTNGFAVLSSQAFGEDVSSIVNNQPREIAQIKEKEIKQAESKKSDATTNSSPQINVSQSFLHNLVSFLQTNVEI